MLYTKTAEFFATEYQRELQCFYFKTAFKELIFQTLNRYHLKSTRTVKLHYNGTLSLDEEMGPTNHIIIIIIIIIIVIVVVVFVIIIVVVVTIIIVVVLVIAVVIVIIIVIIVVVVIVIIIIIIVVVVVVAVVAANSQHTVLAGCSFAESGFHPEIRGHRDQSTHNSSKYRSLFVIVLFLYHLN